MASSSVRGKSVLVVSNANWVGTARMPRVLKKAGWHVSVLTHPRHYLWASGHVDRRFFLSGLPKDVPEALFLHLEKHRYDEIMIGDEPALLAMVRDPKPYAQNPFPVPEEKLACVTGKSGFVQEASGIPGLIPDSGSCAAWEEIEETVARIGFPVVVKPSVGFGGKGVCRLNDGEEVEKARYSIESRLPAVVQKFIIGKTASSSVLYDHGKPLAWISSYKTLVHPEPYGPSCVRELAEFPHLAPVVENIGRLTGTHGFASIDWIEEEGTGRIFVLEFAPRVTPDLPLAALCNVDFSRALQEIGKPGARIQGPRLEENVKVYMFPQHLKRCIEADRWTELAFWIPGRARHDIPWDDPRLLASLLVNELGRSLFFRVLAWFRD